MADTDTMESTATDKRTLSLAERIVVGLCVVGIVAAVAVAFSTSSIAFLDAHMFEVVGDWWTTDATVGLIVALVTAVAVGAFVIVLSRATIASNETDDESA